MAVFSANPGAILSFVISVDAPDNIVIREGEQVTIGIEVTGVEGTGLGEYFFWVVGLYETAEQNSDYHYLSDHLPWARELADPDGYVFTTTFGCRADKDGEYEAPESFAVEIDIYFGATFADGSTKKTISVTIVDAFDAGSNGNDAFYGTSGIDKYIGFSGNDFLQGLDGDDHFMGESGDDILMGDGGSDRLDGSTGRDILNGGNDADSLWGDEDNDQLFGGSGDDTLEGGTGDDRLSGDAGADTLRGGAGEDRLDGGGGDDYLLGDRQNDDLIGGGGNDILMGLEGDDRLRGGGGRDELNATGGNDLLYGDGSHDIISAGSGNDVLHGGAGRDWLVGGSGSDRLMGGSGGDRFDFAGGKDVIVDFADDQDIIGVDDYALHTPVRYWEDLVARTRVVHGDLVINFGHGDVLTILGITDVESLRNDMGFV